MSCLSPVGDTCFEESKLLPQVAFCTGLRKWWEAEGGVEVLGKKVNGRESHTDRDATVWPLLN